MRVPEHLSRADIGAYMRDLRRHYGLSEQDVSERLHIRAKYVLAIEEANFDAMPGKAYARGYVHTYAEFLGLDADQIVERCFGAELAREAQAHTLPDSTRWTMSQRRRGGMLLVAVVLGSLAYALWEGATDETSATATLDAGVEQVPEEFLASTRTRLMPTADQHHCLTTGAALGCFTAHRQTQQFLYPAPVPDMAPAAVKRPSVPEPEKEETEEKASKEREKKPSSTVKNLNEELAKKRATAKKETRGEAASEKAKPSPKKEPRP